MDGLISRRDLDCRISGDVDRDVVTGRRHRIVRPVARDRPALAVGRAGPAHIGKEGSRLEPVECQPPGSCAANAKRLTLLYGRVNPRQSLPHVDGPHERSLLDRLAESGNSNEGVLPEPSRSHVGSLNDPALRSFDTIIDSTAQLRRCAAVDVDPLHELMHGTMIASIKA